MSAIASKVNEASELGNSNAPSQQSDQASTFAVRACRNGTCVLSGARAPQDVESLVVLVGNDHVDYTISKKCLQRYSRQIYTFGIAAMAKMMNSHVLLCGLSGLGVEVAKNVILAGVKSFTIYDDQLVTAQDLASNFYATEISYDIDASEPHPNIGKKRSAVCAEKLRQLNPLTPVHIYQKERMTCTKEGLGQYRVCVYVDGNLDQLNEFGKFCHENQICFIATGTYGLYGYAFSDFGEKFKVSDATGENVQSGIICGLKIVKPNCNTNSSNSKQTTLLQVFTDQDSKHGLHEGDRVTLNGIKCLTGLPERSNPDTNIEDGKLTRYGRPQSFSVIPVIDIVPNETPNDNVRKIVSQTSFFIDVTQYPVEPTGHWGENTSGGYWNKEKERATVAHRTFSESMDNCVGFDTSGQSGLEHCEKIRKMPLFVNSDFADEWKSLKLHAFLKGLLVFEKVKSYVPRPGNVTDAELVTSFAIQELKTYETYNDLKSSWESTHNDNDDAKIEGVDSCLKHLEELYMTLALGAQGKLSPAAAFFGGVVGQEVIKACSGKYMPLNQWLHLEYTTCLPRLWSRQDGALLSEEDVKPSNSRYDGQIAVFGRSFQKKLASTSIFLVGSGALGCEFLKSFAMTGLGCSSGNQGVVHVTDMDTVEVSNLNRQFLFRDADVGQIKSTVAVKSATKMNAEMNAVAHAVKVSPETEHFFTDDFWEEVGIVVNALDNVEARRYVDAKCSFYRKPLFESGTLGTKANVQPIIPSLTEGYSDGPNDQPEIDIPVCTLKSFPYLIEHTLAWAKEQFFTEFHEKPSQAAKYMRNRDSYITTLQSQNNSRYRNLTYLKDMVGNSIPMTFDDCIAWARFQFDVYFKHSILQLLSNYPANKRTDDGKYFWTGKRKCPTVVEFDPKNVNHKMFIVSAAHLRARIFGIHENLGYRESQILNVAEGVVPPEFVVNESVKIAANEEEAKKLGGAEVQVPDDNTLFLELLNYIQSADQYSNYHMEHFEKDDDSNYHMDFITATSNIRANSYFIPEADKMRSTQIVGRIIPAVATTTALTTGAVIFEVFKYLNQNMSGSSSGGESALVYRSSNFNLAINAYYQFEPALADAYYFNGKQYTSWDYIELDNDMTMANFREWFENDFLNDESGKEATVSMIATYGSNPVTVYNDFLDEKLIESRNDVLLSQLVREITGEDLKGSYLLLSVDVDFEESSDDDSEDDSCSEDDDDIKIPLIRIKHKKK